MDEADIEQTLRSFPDLFQNSSQWNYRPKFQKGSYNEKMEKSAEKVIEDLENQDNVDWTSPEITFENQLGNTHVNFNLTPGNSESLAQGSLEVLFEDAYPEITNTQEAEKGSLLYEIRRNHFDTVKEHQTDYIEPQFHNYVVNGREEETHQWEIIAEFSIPENPDPEEMQRTVEAFNDISAEIDNVYSDLCQTAGNYSG